MKVVCVGGGPAGLYFSLLMKRQDPAHQVAVLERDEAGATYGWGVTYWRALIEELDAHDPVSAATIRRSSVCWQGGTAHVGQAVVHQEGDQGHGIGRHRLLEILTDRARELGVHVEHRREVSAPGDLPEADLVVAADGVRSRLRQAGAEHFGPLETAGRNTYLWLGTTRAFPTFTFAFRDTPRGWIWCYAYPFDQEQGTCVVECAPETARGLGLDQCSAAEGLALMEELFADPLQGHRLTTRQVSGGRLPWQTFRTLTNRTWHHGNLVLLGDAAHTTHYSVGAGTTLALQDAAALARALQGGGDLDVALAAYESERKAALLPVQSAARYSAQWYENLPRYLRLPPEQMFALLGQRHSPLLPYVPPQWYYRLDQAADSLQTLKKIKRWVGPRVAGALQGRSRTHV
ncbi:FAD-dependent monooxygenase [Streptomyces sp. NPDC059740]|uniref:FAD-dependent monooxygenase n=1 Tax=Streptomyces sp. NPDC059740 TaxID=3346926 RepID=UPI003656238C